MPSTFAKQQKVADLLALKQHLCRLVLSQEHCVDAFFPGLFILFLCPVRKKTAYILRLA